MLARLALRLAAVECLCPTSVASAGPWPTIAGSRVYDSRQDPIDGLDDIEARPLLIVYTEQDNSQPYGSAVHKPDESIVEIVIEAMIAARGTVEIQTGASTVETLGTVESPISDRDHEAALDLLEAAVRRRFLGRDPDAAATLWRKVAWECRHVESSPMRNAERSVRVAARTITFRVKVKSDDWSALGASGMDRLPEPLRTVANALPAGSGRDVCTWTAARVQTVTAGSSLAGIDIYTAQNRTPTGAGDAQDKAKA